MRKFWIPCAAFLGITGVAMAAYTSHGLGFIADPQAREVARGSLQMAVHQHMLHALALLAVGVWGLQAAANRWLSLAGCLLVLGVLLFSGLIYLRIFLGIDTFRALVPFGGVSLMLAWGALGIAGYQATKD